MKKSTFIILLIFFLIETNQLKSQGIPISKTLFGINAWYLNFAQTSTVNFALEFTNLLPVIKASGCTHVRIGGIDPNWEQIYNFHPQNHTVNATTDIARLEKLIKAIRGAGMEVILQVSYSPPNVCPNFSPQSGNSSLGALTLAQQSEVAGNLVAVLNKTVFPGSQRIQYWSISNEPDFAVPSNCSNPVLDGGFGASLATTVTGVSSATFIAEYIQAFSKARKNRISILLSWVRT